jgi:hypothetical protein
VPRLELGGLGVGGTGAQGDLLVVPAVPDRVDGGRDRLVAHVLLGVIVKVKEIEDVGWWKHSVD